jgi:hypothetical protein
MSSAVFGIGIVGDRPRRVGGGVPHHQEQQGLQLVGTERRIRSEHLPELLRERLVLELVAQAPQQVGLDEHLLSLLLVELQDVDDGHAGGEAGGDDSPGAGAGYVVEVVGEAEIRLAALRLQQVLDPLQYFECENTANAAAVDRKQLLSALALDSLRECHGLPPVSVM